MKAFGHSTLGKNDLVGVKQHVEIFDLATFLNEHSIPIDQIFGGSQNFVFAKQQLRRRSASDRPLMPATLSVMTAVPAAVVDPV